MRVLYITNEYPPNIYGGAGVHIQHLSREMARMIEVEVRCFGDQEVAAGSDAPQVRGYSPWSEVSARADKRLGKALKPLSINLLQAADPVTADLVHCHTWYSLMAGLWIKLLYDIPLVCTTHSLEPRRPWKEEQLGRGYVLSSWIERVGLQSADAVVAVSEATRQEVLHFYDIPPEKVRVIHNGIDPEVFKRVDPGPGLNRLGLPANQPYGLFVGRITRQKGVVHLVRALRHVDPDLAFVLCAGAPDTEEIEKELEEEVSRLRKERGNIYWIRGMLNVESAVALYSGARLFVCPSVYEPFGIINLEAMGCGCPVVATRVGGIPEVVVHEETGLLVPFAPKSETDFEAKDPEQLSRDLAVSINRLNADSDLRSKMSRAARERVVQSFTWSQIARQTLDLYRQIASDQ